MADGQLEAEALIFATVRKTSSLVGEGQWRKWALIVALALSVSLFEMAGAALVYVLVTIISSPTGPIELPMLGDVRALFGDTSDRSVLIGLVVVLALFFLIRAVVRIGATYAQARVAYNAGARLSNRLTRGYLNAPYEFHLTRNSATLIRNTHVAVNQLVREVFLPIIHITSESLIVFGLILVMLFIAPTASLIAIAVVGTSAFILLVLIQPRLKSIGRTAHIANEETLSFLQQALQGIRDVKLLRRADWFTQAYAKSRLRLARALYLRNALTEVPRTLIELSLIGFILAYFGATIFVELDSPATVSVLGLFAYVGLRLQPSIQKIVAGLNSLKFASAPLDDLNEDASLVDQWPREPTPRQVGFHREIVLRDVSFRYEGSSSFALSNVSLTIKKGEQIGVCGPTGGGKSTLVDLISGLLEPTSGEVLVDGRSIRGREARGWQAHLGVVPQDVFLLDDTLRRNVAFGVPDHEIDPEAINDALTSAQIREFVESLPQGLGTQVGERGVRLSGGQRQRIAIARALYRHPEVLVFDEGTSALDNETEAALMEAIEALRGSHTIILVAHRLTTVRNSDRVVVIEGGRLIADGPFGSTIDQAL